LGKLIIEGSSVYEVDEDCLKKRKIPAGCGVKEALVRQRERDDKNKKT
jgi:hypothetical protein